MVNDADMALWYALGISSWPTQVVVSPTGKLIIALPGEDRSTDIDACIQAALEYYGEAGLLLDREVPVVCRPPFPHAHVPMHRVSYGRPELFNYMRTS